METKQFRFEDLEIWRRGAALTQELFQLADTSEQKHLYRFAEQLRGATLSITNNIAEGSGSLSNRDSANFLNTARRSVFEVANILFILARGGYLPIEFKDRLLPGLPEESRMILRFIKTLRQ